MSRSRRKKKHHEHRVTKWDAEQYNQGVETDPLGSSPFAPPGQHAAGPSSANRRGVKDSDASAVPSTDPEPELGPLVRVFSLEEPPRYLHSISEWLARDAIGRCEATLLRTSARVRGIQYVAKTQPDPVTPEKPCALRTDSIGDVHSHDTETNPQGVYCFYPFPPSGRALDRFIRDVFREVLDSCKESRSAGKIAL